MSELRFAVIGTGFWARFQLAAWNELDGARCVALCDTDGSKAEELGRRFGMETAYADADEMLRHHAVDFVDIITPPHTHKDVVQWAASHKVAAICQKPLAETLEDAQQMAAVCQRAGVPLFVHENFRWQYPMRRLKETIAKGEVGDIFRARVHFCSSYPVFDNQPSLRELPRFIVSDVGTHILDVTRFLFGEVKALYCTTRRVNPHIRGEDVATVMMQTRGGATVIAEMSYASRTAQERFPQTYVYAEGSCGSVDLTQDYWLRVTTKHGIHQQRHAPRRYAWADPEYEVVHASLVDCNADSLRALQRGELAECHADDNLKTLRLVCAAYESAETNRVIDVDSQTGSGLNP